MWGAEGLGSETYLNDMPVRRYNIEIWVDRSSVYTEELVKEEGISGCTNRSVCGRYGRCERPKPLLLKRGAMLVQGCGKRVDIEDTVNVGATERGECVPSSGSN
jgi:hypothetical protein